MSFSTIASVKESTAIKLLRTLAKELNLGGNLSCGAIRVDRRNPNEFNSSLFGKVAISAV